MSQVKLGNKVRDLTTGVTGIATNLTTLLNGCVQVVIQPVCGEDNKLVENISTDVDMVEVIGDGVAGRNTNATYTSNIQLGNKVYDLVTGIAGIAVAKSQCLNGCALFEIAHKGEGSESDKNFLCWVDQIRLEILDEGVAGKLIKVEPTKEGKQPGGPMRRNVPRF